MEKRREIMFETCMMECESIQGEEPVMLYKEHFDRVEEMGYIKRKCPKISAEVRKEGNQLYVSKKHNKKIHSTILKLYSKSIAFAPPHSEELATAYNNRSALLLHLHKYDESIIDIERAAQITKSEELKVKLRSREQKCLISKKGSNDKGQQPSINTDDILNFYDLERMKEELVASQNKVCKRLPLPEIKRSKEIDCVAEGVAVNYNKTHGRHLIASRDLKPGEIVIVEESYAYAPKNDHIYLICSYCMGPAWCGIPCDSCVFTIYCTEKCKEEAWQQYHHVECSILPFFYCEELEFVNLPHVIAMTRLLIIAIKREGLENIFNDAKIIENQKDEHTTGFLSNKNSRNHIFRLYYNLLSHEEFSNGDSSIHQNEYMIIYTLLSYTNLIKTKSTYTESGIIDAMFLTNIKNIVIKLKGIFILNCDTYEAYVCNCIDRHLCSTNCDVQKGVIIAPYASLLNHSCSPNVNKMFLPDRKVVCFTMKPIKKGEQLRYSYGPTVFMNKTERQSYLKKNFDFDCNCQACFENWPTNLLEKWNPDVQGKLMSLFKENNNYSRLIVLFTTSQNEWAYNEATLRDAITICELVHKCCTGFEAFSYTFPFLYFIDKLFYKLYGEDYYDIPEDC